MSKETEYTVLFTIPHVTVEYRMRATTFEDALQAARGLKVSDLIEARYDEDSIDWADGPEITGVLA